MKGQPYKKTFAASGSQLYQALQDKNSKLAEQLYKQSTDNFDKTHGPGARHWFENWRTDETHIQHAADVST